MTSSMALRTTSATGSTTSTDARDGAAERAGLEVGLEHQVVATRDDGSGEAVQVGALRVGHRWCSSDSGTESGA